MATKRPFGWILTGGFRGNPRSSASSAARIVLLKVCDERFYVARLAKLGVVAPIGH